MRDGVPANRACATLNPNDLALKAIIGRQDDAATVQRREEIAEQLTLGLLGQLIRDAMLAEQLARKLAGVSVAGHAADTIGFQQRREVVDHRIKRERRAGLAIRSWLPSACSILMRTNTRCADLVNTQNAGLRGNIIEHQAKALAFGDQVEDSLVTWCTHGDGDVPETVRRPRGVAALVLAGGGRRALKHNLEAGAARPAQKTRRTRPARPSRASRART
jgi:hypothetical protein